MHHASCFFTHPVSRKQFLVKLQSACFEELLGDGQNTDLRSMDSLNGLPLKWKETVVVRRWER